MRRMAVVLGLVASAFTGSAFAVGGLADVAVYDRSSGRILPVYAADGEHYVAGRPGNEYELRIRNNTNEEILAVVSVDGVNVVTGETAAPSQSGYVIGPWRSLSINGWRKSLSRVATFYFTDHSDAYATRTGRPDDVGVIGVAVFKRKYVPPVAIDVPYPKRYREGMRDNSESSKDSGAARSAAPPAQAQAEPQLPQAQEKSLGTGHGRSESSQARYTQFEREAQTPNEVIAIRYDTRANLVARGVIVEPVREPRREPNPFPARFVADPPARW